jgi:hypothetical protein
MGVYLKFMFSIFGDVFLHEDTFKLLNVRNIGKVHIMCIQCMHVLITNICNEMLGAIHAIALCFSYISWRKDLQVKVRHTHSMNWNFP